MNFVLILITPQINIEFTYNDVYATYFKMYYNLDCIH